MFYNLVSFQPTVSIFLSYWNILGTYLPVCSPVALIMSFGDALSKAVYLLLSTILSMSFPGAFEHSRVSVKCHRLAEEAKAVPL